MNKWKPSKINNKWMMTMIVPFDIVYGAEACIDSREMKWWEKILYWRKTR